MLQIGTDSSTVALGLHPRLTGLKQIFDQGRLALIQRTGYPNQSRSHFLGTDIWSTADPSNSSGLGWVGRYLDSLPSPVDPLVGWNTTRRSCRTCCSRSTSAVPAIPEPGGLLVLQPEHRRRSGGRAQQRRFASRRTCRSIVPSLSFVYGSAQAALATLDRVATVASTRRRSTYPNTGFGQALQAVAGAMVKGIGTRVFYVTDRRIRHALGAELNAANGTYYDLMATLTTRCSRSTTI